MTGLLGNSGAPRWYDCDAARFPHYLDQIVAAGATAAEIVLHDGEADEFTSRVHVVRSDWESVIDGYRSRGLWVSVHGPLTPEFSARHWNTARRELLNRYQPVLRQVADLAEEQGATNLVLHAAADPALDLLGNERVTAEFVQSIGELIGRWSSRVNVVLELRAENSARPSAAALSRASVLRILNLVNHSSVGICWDLAHDMENAIATGSGWTRPPDAFLERVRHLHLHDLGEDGEPHCPPLIGRVPISDGPKLCPTVSAIMEIRWRMAERMGAPWEILAKSYQAVLSQLAR